LQRPVRLLSRPAPIRVIALVPDGPPAWLSYRGREQCIVHAAGPERIETAWWRGPDIRRDYFRITTDTGEQFWIFHAAVEDQWYLHGFFV
jgi:protein ImuB